MRKGKRPHGQLRQSQVVTTFGPGAMLELPTILFWSEDWNIGVLVGLKFLSRV